MNSIGALMAFSASLFFLLTQAGCDFMSSNLTRSKAASQIKNQTAKYIVREIVSLLKQPAQAARQHKARRLAWCKAFTPQSPANFAGRRLGRFLRFASAAWACASARSTAPGAAMGRSALGSPQ